VVVSYFEYVQNLYSFYWEEKGVYSQLDKKIVTAFEAVYKMAKEHEVDNRTAAYMIAISRVVDAMKLWGWI